MYSQADLTLTSENKSAYFSGFEEYGPMVDSIRRAGAENKDVKLANKVLQFIFNGITGFRFPVCHYPVTSMTAHELGLLVQQVMTALAKNNFQVTHRISTFTSNSSSYQRKRY